MLQTGVFLTDLGEKIEEKHGQVYVSRDAGGSWQPLHDLAHVSNRYIDMFLAQLYSVVKSVFPSVCSCISCQQTHFELGKQFLGSVCAKSFFCPGS